MAETTSSASPWLRPMPGPPAAAGETGRPGIAHAGCPVRPGLRLSQLVHRRPPGITANQWNTALRTTFDQVAGDSRTALPLVAVELVDPARRGPAATRADRMTETVCTAVGLGLVRVESTVLVAAGYGRQVIRYVLDARAFRAGGVVSSPAPVGGLQPPPPPAVAGFQSPSAVDEPSAEEPLDYRAIIGRLPDGRSGFVNDLGALARSAAVEAYAGRQLGDPIIRGLHVRWRDRFAEGWAWALVREGHYLFERVRLWEHPGTCGIDPGQFAEDLAVVAIGERLKAPETAGPALRDRTTLSRELTELRARRHEMVDGFRFEHVSF